MTTTSEGNWVGPDWVDIHLNKSEADVVADCVIECLWVHEKLPQSAVRRERMRILSSILTELRTKGVEV
jgi:hypothetical protein